MKLQVSPGTAGIAQRISEKQLVAKRLKVLKQVTMMKCSQNEY